MINYQLPAYKFRWLDILCLGGHEALRHLLPAALRDVGGLQGRAGALRHIEIDHPLPEEPAAAAGADRRHGAFPRRGKSEERRDEENQEKLAAAASVTGWKPQTNDVCV